MWAAGVTAASAQAVRDRPRRHTRHADRHGRPGHGIDRRRRPADEPAWEQAVPATDFIQKFPNNGAPSTERTEVRFLYDDDNLYVGVICFDSEPDKLVIKDLSEDFELERHRCGPDRHRQPARQALRRSSSASTPPARGATARCPTATGSTRTGTASGTRRSAGREDAWFIEYVIPFKTLRFSNAPSQEWGVNISRRILHKNEESELGADSRPLHRDAVGPGGHAARPREHPAGAEPEGQAVR